MIIVVAIICLVPSVCADGNTANQIKFRDFDFGVSIDQLEESFNQPKVHTYTNEEALSPIGQHLKVICLLYLHHRIIQDGVC